MLLVKNEYHQAFVDGVMTMCKTMCQSEAQTGTPLLHFDESITQFPSIGSTIEVDTDFETATAALSFQQSVYLKAMERILESPCECLTDDIKDGVAEMMNIIFGHAKKDLNAKGQSIKLALPSIALEPFLRRFQNRETITIPFHSDFGMFHLILSTPLKKELPHV